MMHIVRAWDGFYAILGVMTIEVDVFSGVMGMGFMVDISDDLAILFFFYEDV